MDNFKFDKRIKELAKSKGISVRQICKKIEMTQSGLVRSLNNNTLKIQTLQKISEVLEVPITHFFGIEENKTSDTIEHPIKITIKELDFQMSKEQAMRSGIVKHLFDDRKENYFESLDFEAKDRKVFASDIQGIKVYIKDLIIIGY